MKLNGKKSPWSGVTLAGALVLDLTLALLTIHQLQPPQAVPAGAPRGSFSSERALQVVRELSIEPRPLGSPAHTRARLFIVRELEKLGLKPITQKSTAAVEVPGFGWVSAGAIENILVKIPGTASTGTLLLAAHYDSVRNSKGASDDAAGVATLLETVRALRAAGSAPLKQDLLLLFSDGEENALLGAQAFMNDGAQAREVKSIKLALNFEARGSGGPSSMYETSPLQGPLIEEFARTQVTRVVSNSLVPAVARALPNDTDFSVFRAHGIAGLSFAYAGGLEHYHSFLDDVNRLDPGSLQQHGDYALALTRQLGGLVEFPKPGPDRVYFDFFGLHLISYPAALVPWLSLLCLMLFWRRLRVRKLKLSKELFRSGALFVLVSFLAITGVSLLAYAASHFRDSLLILHASLPFLLAYTLIALGILFGLLTRWRALNPLGVTFFLLLFTLVLSTFLPGASYVLQLPILATLLFPSATALGAVFFTYTGYVLYIAVGSAVPGAFLLPVLAYVGLSFSHPPMTEIFRRKSLWKSLLLIGGLLFSTTLAFIQYSSRFPEPSFVAYAVDLDHGNQAYWVTDSEKKAPWLSQFRQGARLVASDEIPWFTSVQSSEKLAIAPAPLTRLSPPEMKVLPSNDSSPTPPGFRRVRFRLRSTRGARCLLFWEEQGRDARVTRVDGQAPHQYLRISKSADKLLGGLLRNKSATDWTLSFCGAPPEGVVFEIETPRGEPLEIRYQDKSEGFPVGTTPLARPPELIPSGGSDVVILSSSVTL